MKTRSVQQILPPPPTHWVGNGFRVHNFFPGVLDMQRMSPYFLMDYNAKMEFAPGGQPRGVGVHPHRGIETVTIAFHGKIAHHDSGGNAGVIGEGDVQWMTAGGGVLHKEYHEENFNKAGGLFQMVQLWVNLPAKFKMTPAKYQSILRNEMANFNLPGESGVIEIIAGEYQGVKGPAFTFSPVNLFVGRFKANAEADFYFPENYNTGILVIEGKLTINQVENAMADHFVLFRNDGETFTVKATEDCIFVVLSGEPLNEPIAPHGPFVMNTREEIIQTYNDFHQGKFGYLED